MEQRFWIIEPNEHDVDADPHAAAFWRIVDEESGGTIAYCSSQESAALVLFLLQKSERADA